MRALGELFSELQVRRVSPQRFAEALARWHAADGAGEERPELARLFASYRAELGRLRRVDAEQRAVRALDALRERPSLWGGAPVAIYGFDDLTALQLDAIETLGALVDARVTVSLAYEPGRAAFAGRAATFHALAPLAADHRPLAARAEHYAPPARSALSHLERSLFEPGAARVAHGAAVRLLEGGGERAELELVSREIVALLGEGFAAQEIAVLARPAGVSLELLEEVFADARIPLVLQRRRALGDTATGGALIGLLRCVAPPAADAREAEGERDADADVNDDGSADGSADVGTLADLLAYLRAPGVLERPALADALELRARRAGVLDSERARALWEERHWPLETLDRLHAAQERGARALLERAARELQWLFAAPRRARAPLLDGDELDEASAVSVARRALAELRELARLDAALAPASAVELARVLADLTLVSGESPEPGMVAVLDPLALRARRVRALFVCGLQEGVFPARERPQPLLGEEERRRLAELSGLRLGERADLLAAERYLLYAALSRPQERLVLSWHAADDDGQPTSRSLFVDDVCDLFERSLLERSRAPRARRERAVGRCETPSAPPARPDEPLRDERVLAELRARPWSASALEALGRLSGQLVRRARAAPGRARPGRRAARARRARARGAEGLPRGIAPRDGQRARDAGDAAARARAARAGARRERTRPAAVGRAGAAQRRAAAPAGRPRALPRTDGGERERARAGRARARLRLRRGRRTRRGE